MNAMEFCGYMWRLRVESGNFSPNQMIEEAKELLGVAAGYVADRSYLEPDQPDADDQLAKSKLCRDYHKWHDNQGRKPK